MVNELEKARLRKEALGKRSFLLESKTERNFTELSSRLTENLEKFLKDKNVASVFSFFPSKGEPDFSSAFFKNHLRWFFPKVNGSDMIFHECRSAGDLIAGAFGIMEPKATSLQIPNENDMILVPALLFDLKGNRLGYGKGFYDRFFSKKNFKNKIGIAFDDFIVQRLPRENFDITVDAILTESKLITVQS